MHRVVALAIMFVFAFGLTAHAEEYVYDRILVKVNDGIITESDLDQKVKTVVERAKERGQAISDEAMHEVKKTLLAKMVEDLLLDMEAQRYGITVDDRDVDEEIARIKAEQNLTEDQFTQMLDQQDITIPELREKMRESIKKQRIIGHMVHDKVLVTDTEVREEYDKNIDQYSSGDLLDISVIVLSPEISSKEVLKRINDGEMTFAQAADTYSQGPGAGDGGKVDGVLKKALSDDWKKALQGVEPGEMTSPMLIGGRETIILLREIRPGEMTPFDQVKDKILRRLMTERRKQVFEDYFKRLHEKAVIIYMDKDLK